MNPYTLLGGALATMLLIATAYITGRHDGRAIADAKQAAVERAVTKEREARQAVVDQGNMAGEQTELARQSSVKEIYHETNTVTERPVYRNVCVDADGVRLLDKARDIANGVDPVQPARQAEPGANGAASGGR